MEEAFNSLADKENKSLMVILDYGGNKISEYPVKNEINRKILIDSSEIKNESAVKRESAIEYADKLINEKQQKDIKQKENLRHIC